MRVADYIGKRRDSVAETELAKALRALPQEEAFEFVREYIEQEPVVGLILAKRVLTDRKYFEQLVQRGFELANVSTIQSWFEVGISRLGPSRVLTLLEAFAEKDGRAASGFLYWAGILLYEADPDQRLRDRFNELRARLEARGYPEPRPI